MIFKPFTSEPYGLWRLYLILLCVTLLLLFAAAFSAYGLHGSLINDLTITCKTDNCISQSNHRNYLLNKDTETKKAAGKRIEQLKRARSDPNDMNFSQPWSWFESEIDQLERITMSKKRYRINSIIGSFPIFIALILGSLLFYLLINRLALLHAKSAYRQSHLHKIICNWMTPQILIGILIAAPMIISELVTSVFATEKTWFGYDSYCVTPSAFVLKCIAYVTFGFVASTPFTTLWCLSRRDHIPHPDTSARDGKFGAERYVEFLQTWTLWLIIAPSIIGIFLFRYVVEMEKVFSFVRLLYGLGVGIMILLIVVRLISNAVILRFRCREDLVGQKIDEADRVPIDPTISFLGTDWWKLPATISVSIASIWGLLEFMGLSKLIVTIVQTSP